MSCCTGITDAGLAHLGGIHTFYLSNCTGITDAGLAHLGGIHTLLMNGCTGIIYAVRQLWMLEQIHSWL